jgi:hypothetical protein
MCTAFALYALIETENVVLLSDAPEAVPTPSNSGKGQKMSRCPRCRVAAWSNYAGFGNDVRSVRVGTLLEPDRLPPDIYISTESKQPWVAVPHGTPAVPEYHRRGSCWPQGQRRSVERHTGQQQVTSGVYEVLCDGTTAVVEPTETRFGLR